MLVSHAVISSQIAHEHLEFGLCIFHQYIGMCVILGNLQNLARLKGMHTLKNAYALTLGKELAQLFCRHLDLDGDLVEGDNRADLGFTDLHDCTFASLELAFDDLATVTYLDL